MNNLFEVKRYWSDSIDEESIADNQSKTINAITIDPSVTQEADILKKLKFKANIKKSLNKSPTKAPLIDHVQSRDEIEDIPLKNEISSPKQKKKRKKRKKKASEGEEQIAGGSKKGGFPVLGENISDQWKKKKLRRSLPHWLANPNVISVDLSDQRMTIESLPGLDEITINNLRKNNVAHFFPVQRQVIPHMLANDPKSIYPPHDICVSAPTGSGKTLAYVLPIGNLKSITLKNNNARCLALILVKYLMTTFRI